MEIWNEWLFVVMELRGAFSRERTFLWFVICLMGMTVRTDLLGVTSIMRFLGLKEECYDRLLDFFHSDAVSPEKLACLWLSLVIRKIPFLVKFNDKPVLSAME